MLCPRCKRRQYQQEVLAMLRVPCSAKRLTGFPLGLIFAACLVGCGGGSGGSSASFTVGGSVSGLTESGLVLRNNGSDDLSINANGSFTFRTALANGSGYSVTVRTQPNGQTCLVSNVAGTVS